MKTKRRKRATRVIRFFRLLFGFSPPYRVLVDGNFLYAALRVKIHLKEQLPKLLLGRTHPGGKKGTTLAAELRNLGEDFRGAALVAKNFERIPCPHHEGPVSPFECLRSVIGEANKDRFFVATNDKDLRGILREVPGVPLLYLKQQVMILEEASDASKTAASQHEEQKLLPAVFERKRLGLAHDQERSPPKKRRRGPKGPNPLSVKKKKKREEEDTTRPPETKEKCNEDDNADDTIE